MWSAPTTTDRNRKELLRTLLAEVLVNVDRPAGHVSLTLRWRGGALTELHVPLPRPNYRPLRTDEDTLALLRRLATHYPDGVIAGILNRQGRRSARGERFTTTMISSLRTYWDIPCFTPPTTPPDGELSLSRRLPDASRPPPRHCFAGCRTASSAVSRSLLARRGAFASLQSCGPASWTKLRPAGCQCRMQPRR